MTIIFNILAVNLGVTFLRIQRLNCDLLVLRPSIDFSRGRTSDILVARVLGEVDLVLGRINTHGCLEETYLDIHGSLGASVYHQLDEGPVSILPHPVGPQLVIRIVLNTVWLRCDVIFVVLNPLLLGEMVLLEVLLYRIIRFRTERIKIPVHSATSYLVMFSPLVPFGFVHVLFISQ